MSSQSSLRPSADRFIRSRGWLIAGALCLGIIVREVLLRVSFHNYYPDDAFIFFRYARSAATGQGLVFNLDEHVMGYSSPLYVLLLSVLASLFGQAHLAGVANILGLILFLASSLVLIRLARSGF